MNSLKLLPVLILLSFCSLSNAQNSLDEIKISESAEAVFIQNQDFKSIVFAYLDYSSCNDEKYQDFIGLYSLFSKEYLNRFFPNINSAEEHETVLYRAIDNWKNLRPPQVDDQKLEERSKLMAELMEKYSNKILDQNIVDIFGPPDSRMGSGMPYVVYYLKDGLVIGLNMKPQMKALSISHPGE
ncbi:MAG: hypothetical protein JXR49_18590 [Acidobacteria bacterium]|nr:hypothetical protein [Acidobacteriota bacterium]